MKYLALIYTDESGWDGLADAERDAMIEQYATEHDVQNLPLDAE